MEQGSLASRKSVEEPCNAAVNNRKSKGGIININIIIIILQLRFEIHVSLDWKLNSLPAIILSLACVFYSLQNQISVSSRQLRYDKKEELVSR